MKARINGVQSKMKDFDFLFGLLLGEQILKHTDNLSKTLQATAMSAVEAYSVAKLCIDVFKKIQTDDDFDLIVLGTCKNHTKFIGSQRSSLTLCMQTS